MASWWLSAVGTRRLSLGMRHSLDFFCLESTGAQGVDRATGTGWCQCRRYSNPFGQSPPDHDASADCCARFLGSKASLDAPTLRGPIFKRSICFLVVHLQQAYTVKQQPLRIVFRPGLQTFLSMSAGMAFRASHTGIRHQRRPVQRNITSSRQVVIGSSTCGKVHDSCRLFGHKGLPEHGGSEFISL